MVIKADKFLDFLSIFAPFKIGGITLFPFIIVRSDVKERTIRHEKIHIEQYKETLVIGFLFIYLQDFLHGLIEYGDRKKAYKRIRFEQEAYYGAKEPIYLDIRSRFSWMKYKI